MARTTKAARNAGKKAGFNRAYGVGASQFDPTCGVPLKIAPLPDTAFTLFDTWRRLAPTLAGTGHTKALCDARAVVGMPATMREEALIEALTETLMKLYDTEADLLERPLQSALDQALEDVEEADDDRRAAEESLKEAAANLAHTTAERDALQRQLAAAEAKVARLESTVKP